MAHHTYNTHNMLRHVEAWTKPTASGTVEMIATSGTSGTTTVTMGTPSTSSSVAGTTTVQWPSAASELCEVVITECLRQQQQLAQQQAATVVAAQQHSQPAGAPTTIVTTASTIAITQDHEVPTMSTTHLAMDDVLRTDMSNIHSHTILPGTTTVAVPVHVVTSNKPKKCGHHHRHHHHHHHHSNASQQHVHHGHIHHQDKQLTASGYNVAPYPCRYRLPSSDLLPNHEELVAAGAIPATTQTMVLHCLPQPVPSPAPPTTTTTTTTKQRKPRAPRGSRGGRGGSTSNRKQQPVNNSGLGQPDGLPAPAPTPVTSTSTFPCPECGKKFLWASRLVVHRRSHTGEKPFPCTQCGAAFAQRWILAVHMRTHNPPEAQPNNQQLDNPQTASMVVSRAPQQTHSMQGQQVEI